MLCLSSAVIGAFIWQAFRKRVISYKANRVRKHGTKGEKIAEQWLEKHGFNIISVQDSVKGEFECDGENIPYQVKPDIIAENEDGTWVIEVKTGKSANPSHGDTRRQILEYAHLYPEHNMALFDADHKLFQPIVFYSDFSPSQKPKTSGIWLLMIGFLMGCIIAALCFYAFMIKS